MKKMDFTYANQRRQLPTPGERPKLVKRVSSLVIEMRCTDGVLMSFTLAIGVMVFAAQTIPIFTHDWVELTEPRPMNLTDDNGVFLETTFHYGLGYFRACREHLVNTNITGNLPEHRLYLTAAEMDYHCKWNPYYTGEDLSDFSIAAVAILNRLPVPALMHVLGTGLCHLALVFGIIGHLRKSSRTLNAAILYIGGGLTVSMAVLQYVCVVDDEMAARMKPDPAGDPSKFSFRYGIGYPFPYRRLFIGYSFFCASLSFLLVQMCACFHAFLYFRRYPTAVEKMLVIPGLKAKIRRIESDRRRAAPPPPNWRAPPVCAVCPPIMYPIRYPTSARSTPPPPPPTRWRPPLVRSPNIMFIMEAV